MDSIDNPLWKKHLSGFLPDSLVEVLIKGLHEEPSVSVRYNPFKEGGGFEGAAQVPWSPYGHLLAERPSFTLDPLFHAGAYYVQDSSAMFVGHVFRQMLEHFPGGHVRVLDLCAAPGGKTTDLAASLRLAFGPAFSLTANEVMRRRVPVLKDNVARWGDPAVKVTACDPEVFGRTENAYDIIVADVPCSGEGMFRKDVKAVEDWSPELVGLCAARQRRIIADVWPALREGGVLVYSTCTFEEAENDANVRWICTQLGAEPLTAEGDAPFKGIVKTPQGYLLLPGLVPGEGQYVAAIRKVGSGVQVEAGGASENRSQRVAERHSSDRIEARRPTVSTGRRDAQRPYGSPAYKGRSANAPTGNNVPDADRILGIDFDKNAYPCVEIDRRTALKYLHGDTFALEDAPKGYVILCYRGLPLGAAKNIGVRCNNLYPSGRRILMDIEGK